jgi:hypothetical protein
MAELLGALYRAGVAVQGGGEEIRRWPAVGFVKASVTGEKTTGWVQFMRGNKGGEMPVRLGFSRARESDQRWRKAQRHSWPGGGGFGVRWWEKTWDGPH